MYERTLLIFAVASFVWPSEARADALQNQVLALAKATRADAYSFRRTIVIERTGAPRKVFVEQYDPRRPAAARWSLVSVDGRVPTPKEATGSQKAKRGTVPSYAEIADWFGAPATPTSAAPGYVMYKFARLPKGALTIGSHDASADTSAEALVNTSAKIPFVEKVRFTSNKAFRMMMVASVQKMTVTSRYRLLPDGHVVPAESASDVAGSMMGKSGQMRSAVTFAEFKPAR